MNILSLKHLFGRGLVIAIPLGVILYIFLKIVAIFEKLVAPISEKIGIHKIFGELTLTVFAVFLIILLVLIMGLLMRLAYFERFGRSMEDVVFKIFPSLNQLKITAIEKLELENNTESWKPVLLFHEERFTPAFIIEQNEEMITLFVLKSVDISNGEFLITRKEAVQYQEITAKEIRQYTRQFGKGFLPLIDKKHFRTV